MLPPIDVGDVRVGFEICEDAWVEQPCRAAVAAHAAARVASTTPNTPAVRGYYANGAVHYEERYCDGQRHDGGDDT